MAACAEVCDLWGHSRPAGPRELRATNPSGALLPGPVRNYPAPPVKIMRPAQNGIHQNAITTRRARRVAASGAPGPSCNEASLASESLLG